MKYRAFCYSIRSYKVYDIATTNNGLDAYSELVMLSFSIKKYSNSSK